MCFVKFKAMKHGDFCAFHQRFVIIDNSVNSSLKFYLCHRGKSLPKLKKKRKHQEKHITYVWKQQNIEIKRGPQNVRRTCNALLMLV